MPQHSAHSKASLTRRVRITGKRAALGVAILAAGGWMLGACGGDDETGSGGAGSTSVSASTGKGGDEGLGGGFTTADVTAQTSGTFSATGTTTSASGSGGSGGTIDPCPAEVGGTYSFAKSYGDMSDQSAGAVATDAAGNTYVTGSYSGTISFGGGTLSNTDPNSATAPDIFVAKLDAAGNHLWSKSFGSAKAQAGQGIAVDAAGNVILTGSFLGTVNFGGATLSAPGCCYQDAFVAKLDGAGNHVWSKQFGGINVDYGYAVAVDASSNIVLVGEYQTPGIDFGGGVLPNAGAYDMFVAKLDANGAYVWAKGFGDSTDQFVKDVAFDSFGNVLVSGDFQGTLNLGGAALVAPGTKSAFVAKLSGAGAHLWSNGYGTTVATALGVATDSTGNVLVVGDYHGEIDFGGGPFSTPTSSDDVFLLKLDGLGSPIWADTYGDNVAQHAVGIATDAAGNIFMTGFFDGTLDLGATPLTTMGGFDMFLAKIDPSGCPVYSKAFGSSLYEAGQAVAVDGSGSVHAVASFSGAVDFGGGVLTASGTDVLVAKFGP